MRMSRAMGKFFEMHVCARVTAKTGIRDPLFRSFVDSVNQKLIFIAQMVLVTKHPNPQIPNATSRHNGYGSTLPRSSKDC